MVVVKAKVVDATHLELSKPISAQQGGTVYVSVAEDAGQEIERQEWLSASSASLQRAYGEAEPDYSDSMVRERNPDYGE